jgi:uncharacterized protein involved in type VI secretion and phage assembly
MSDFLEIVRREIHQVIAAQQFKGTIVATAYDKKNHAIKGVLVPHEVETGWIPISVAHAGNGHGMLVGPKCGSAEKLDGDQFEVSFDNGDPNTPSAKMKQFSAQDKPPEVEQGEILVNHASGMKDKYNADGSRTQTHPNGATDTWDKTGSMVRDLKGQAETVIADLVKNQVAKKIVTGVVHLATG